jgi:hypothetical protein
LSFLLQGFAILFFKLLQFGVIYSSWFMQKNSIQFELASLLLLIIILYQNFVI